VIDIMGVKYMTAKDASKRYGYSVEWFQKRRSEKKPPPYIKLQDKGRVLYPMNDCDNWFQQELKLHT
jgi:hypothetical protein